VSILINATYAIVLCQALLILTIAYLWRER
jgi:hypothetical protein